MIDTISALSTGSGRAALAIIRVSGPDSLKILTDMMARSTAIEVRSPILTELRDINGLILDEAVVTYYKNPRSYTGEDLIEIHSHGNPEIVRAILTDLVSRGTRLAEPGEFTRRALASGKMKLEAVEALDWVLNAQTLEGARIGLRSKLAGLSSSVVEVSQKIESVLVDLQSQLDFSDEEVGDTDRRRIIAGCQDLLKCLDGWQKAYENNRRYLDGWAIALVGPPNSGKSALFNALVGDDRSIVFDQPGTTRDPIEHGLCVEGVNVLMADTAGIRETSDPIERLGIQKTEQLMARSDLICWVTDSGEPPPQWLKDRFKEKRWLLVNSKVDLSGTPLPGALNTSAKAGIGIQDLRLAILARPNTGDDVESGGALTPLTSDRQASFIKLAIKAVSSAIEGLEKGEYLDRVTADLLSANKSLEGIVDRIAPEDVLKAIFARFCIGK